MGLFSKLGTVAGGILGGIYGGPAGAAAGAGAGGALGGAFDPEKKVDTSGIKAQQKRSGAFGAAVKEKREALEKSPTEAPSVSLSTPERSDVRSVATTGTRSADQEELQRAMMARARGEAPSAAELQMKQAQDRAIAQQIALARAQGTAAAERTAQRATAQMQQQIASDTAILRAQEQAAAEKAAMESATAQRAQQMADLDRQLKAEMANQGIDLDMLKLQALQGNEEARLNLEAQLKSRGLDNDLIRTYLAAEAGSLGDALAAQRLATSTAIAEQGREDRLIGGAMKGLGAFLSTQGSKDKGK